MFGVVLASLLKGHIQRGESLSRERRGTCVVSKRTSSPGSLKSRYVAAMGIYSCIACELARQHETPHSPVTRVMCWASRPPGLTIVVAQADHPRSTGN